jgi:hypothetical protein
MAPLALALALAAGILRQISWAVIGARRGHVRWRRRSYSGPARLLG